MLGVGVGVGVGIGVGVGFGIGVAAAVVVVGFAAVVAPSLLGEGFAVDTCCVSLLSLALAWVFCKS
jgi:hypothetical protein